MGLAKVGRVLAGTARLARSPTAWFRLAVVALLLWNTLEIKAAREAAESAESAAERAADEAQDAAGSAQAAADEAENTALACRLR